MLVGHLDSKVVDFGEPVRDAVGEMCKTFERVHCLEFEAGRVPWSGGDDRKYGDCDEGYVGSSWSVGS